VHVTFVTSAFLHPERTDFPGVRRYSTDLVAALDRKGLSIRVVTPEDDEEGTPVQGNVEVLRLGGKWRRLGRVGNIGQARILSFARSLARNGRATEETDLIHTTIPLLSIDSIRARRPIVAMGHHVEQVRSPQDLISVPFGNSYGAYTYRRADLVVVPSRATASRLARRFNVNRRKVRVIHHGVDKSKFFPDEARKATGEDALKTILFVGPMNARKNVLLLIDAFARLVRTHPSSRIVLVGRGPLDRRIDMLSQRYSLQGKVVRIEHLNDSALRQLYGSADVYASPSLDEGFGFSVVEAMACRTPVVVLDTPVNREVVGDAGVLVAEASIEAWTLALRQVLDNVEYAESLATRGYNRATGEYSWDVAAQEHIKMYRDALNART